MKSKIYKNLTIEEKTGLLHYIRGQQGLAQHIHYESLSTNPSPTPCPDKVYISSVLDIDFEEFYGSQAEIDKSILYKKELSKKTVKLGGHSSTFIGDALCDIFFVRLDINTNRVINKEFVEDIDTEIKELYDFYIRLGQKYIEVKGLLHEGEKVYRRVK